MIYANKPKKKISRSAVYVVAISMYIETFIHIRYQMYMLIAVPHSVIVSQFIYQKESYFK